MNTIECLICRKAIGIASQAVLAPAVGTLLGGAVAHRGRRDATLGETLAGGLLGLLGGLAVNAVTNATQDAICGECRARQQEPQV